MASLVIPSFFPPYLELINFDFNEEGSRKNPECAMVSGT
jgi:hypothetical protein